MLLSNVAVPWLRAAAFRAFTLERHASMAALASSLLAFKHDTLRRVT